MKYERAFIFKITYWDNWLCQECDAFIRIRTGDVKDAWEGAIKIAIRDYENLESISYERIEDV